MEPQLLTVIEEEKLKTWPESEWRKWQIEPKTDGARLLIVDGIPQSRTGKPLHNIDHILREIGVGLSGVVFDGELHGSTWEETMHVARASKSERDVKLTYTIFDMLTYDEWNHKFCARQLRQRQKELRDLGIGNDHIKIVQPLEGFSYIDFHLLHMGHLHMGCDGTVLKRIDSLYEFKRTRTWLKVKPVEDFDAQVVGMESGKGKYSKTLGKLLCCGPNGVEFGLSGMTDAQRHAWWNDQHSIIGKVVEVQCRGFHKSGAPIEPRFHRLREDKNI